MYLNPRIIPPAFIVDAIPGARELADAVVAARAKTGEAAQTLRAAGEKARELSTHHIMDPENRPKAGVSRHDWIAALDAYRIANDESTAAQRAHDRALAALHKHAKEGMRAPEFIEKHEALGDEAHAIAVKALADLKTALAERDEFDRSIGRRRGAKGNVIGHLDDRTYFFSAIEKIVGAPIITEESAARDELAGMVATPDQRIAFARSKGLVK